MKRAMRMKKKLFAKEGYEVGISNPRDKKPRPLRAIRGK